ncbi:hypothetical protein HDU92_006556 [Lobulomyces angularis]|nr:hypothetical protein HDU92_006556 [Lobulomyces angularis]
MTDVSKYKFNHTMIRIKDPKASHHFYSDLLGFSLIHKADHEEGKFTLYFYGYNPPAELKTEEEKKAYVFSTQGILELTHNWGTENDQEFKGYHSGNAEPKGFGHIAITVDNVEACCQRLEEKGIVDKKRWVKKPQDGKMKGIAFVTDPDGYWIEIVPIRSIL